MECWNKMRIREGEELPKVDDGIWTVSLPCFVAGEMSHRDFGVGSAWIE